MDGKRTNVTSSFEPKKHKTNIQKKNQYGLWLIASGKGESGAKAPPLADRPDCHRIVTFAAAPFHLWRGWPARTTAEDSVFLEIELNKREKSVSQSGPCLFLLLRVTD